MGYVNGVFVDVDGSVSYCWWHSLPRLATVRPAAARVSTPDLELHPGVGVSSAAATHPPVERAVHP
jgi:hypothetical protein